MIERLSFLNIISLSHSYHSSCSTMLSWKRSPELQAGGQTDRQKKREQQCSGVDAQSGDGLVYRWRAAAGCSRVARRWPAALSASPAGAGPPHSGSCPSTTGSPVDTQQHLLTHTTTGSPVDTQQHLLTHTARRSSASRRRRTAPPRGGQH